MTQNKTRLVSAGVFFLLVALGLAIALRFATFAFSPLHPGTNQSAIIEVHKGEPSGTITQLLRTQGVIEDISLFRWLGRVTRQWNRVKAGEYRVSAGMTPMELFSILTSGISIPHPVTVREGENMYEVAADVEAKGLASRARLLELCKDPKFISSLGLGGEAGKIQTLEGYLFPDTYNFNKTLTPEDMIRAMVHHFLTVWGAQEDAQARILGMTRHEALTLASIIEKETGSSPERPMISSVFHNRLKKGMRLQSDPTTIYGIWDRYRGNLHKSDLLESTPYNTYTISGLPPGPISNPGREAIHAALFPANSGFLYFVSHNDGSHEFTQTYEDHLRAVQKFQLDPAAREGKSWRDLTRKAAQPTTTAPAGASIAKPTAQSVKR